MCVCVCIIASEVNLRCRGAKGRKELEVILRNLTLGIVVVGFTEASMGRKQNEVLVQPCWGRNSSTMAKVGPKLGYRCRR